MGTPSVIIDPSTIKPIEGLDSAPSVTPQVALQGAVSFAAQQSPDHYAKLLKFQQITGIPPVVSKGNEQQVQQAVDANSIDTDHLTTVAPRTSAWASNPDNAAVSGVDEIHRLAGIELNASAMRSIPQAPENLLSSTWSALKDAITHPIETLVGGDTPAVAAEKQASVAQAGQATGDPFLKSIATVQQAAQNPLLSVSGTKTFQNLLDPRSRNVFSRAVTGGVKSIEALSSPDNLELLSTLPFAPEDASALISGVFSGQMAEGASSGGYDAIRSAYNGDYGDAAEKGAAALMSAAFAASSGKHALSDKVTNELSPTATPPAAPRLEDAFPSGGFLSNLTQAVNAAQESKLRDIAPDKFYEANQANFAGDASLRIPADRFNEYFQGKQLDPQAAASSVGSTNYTEAVLSGGDVEVPPANFLSNLDPEHQKGLLADVVDPSTGLTARQHQEGRQDINDWITNGGADKLVADTQAADAETAATPEYQDVKEQLRQKYTDAGETPEVAETLATKDANAYSNLARNAGMKPSELLGLYNPKVIAGEAPGATEADLEDQSILHQGGDFGTKHEQFYHDAKGAIDQLLSDKNGEAVGALHHSDVGDIDLIYGKERSSENSGFGLAKIAQLHPEVLDDLQGFLDKLHVESKSGNRIRLADDSGKAVVRLSREGSDRPWLLTAFAKKEGLSAADSGTTAVTDRAEPAPENPAGQEADKGILHQSASNSIPPEVQAARDRLDEASKRWSDEATKPSKNKRGMNAANAELDAAGRDLEQIQNKHGLTNSSEMQPRGWFRVLPDGSYEIGKTKIGDLSTFVHEPAHAYMKIIGDLAKRDGASDTLKGDYQKILDFLGAKDGEPLTREQQETWARANEQYLREGKAPSSSLKGTFQRFAIWLGSVYKKASDLGVNLSDDIRGVFDRLYAAEDGVNKAESEDGPKLFKSAEEAGWNEVQFKAYADMNNVSVEQAKSQILGMMNDAAIREKTESWRDEEKNVREAVTADIDQRPEYAAIRALRKGKLDDGTDLTLSKDELVKQFGEDRVKDLQKQHPGMYRNEGGVEPETAAEILGFDSAESMMKSLESAPRRSAAIEQTTRDYMTAKHGDIRYDGTLDDQARLALENDKRSDGLYSELKALQKKLADAKEQDANRKIAARSVAVGPIESYREAAHQMVESKAVADIQPTRYLDASRKYSRESFDAMRQGDYWEAAQAKHKELMNHFLFREATKAKEYIGKFESYAKRMQTKGVQGKLGLAGSDYRDQFNRIMGRYGLGPNVTAPERTLADWATAQYDEGKEPAIDSAILNEARTVNYRNAPVSEIRSVHDALINVRKLASLELGMEVNGRKIEFNVAMESMSAKARESIKSKPRPVLGENRTAGMKAEDLVNRGTALLARTEFLMKRLDGGDSGPWHENLWHLAADSQGRESELQEEVTKRVGDALQNISKDQLMKLLDKVTIDGISEPVTRKSMLAMAFNMGNEGNLNRLEKTFVAHGWDPRAIEEVKGKLTREEWKFVQDGWDSLKPLGQAQSELEKRLTGLPPIMVKPEPFTVELADGSKMDMEGGYYPVVMDPRFSARGAQQDAGKTAQNLMESGYGRAATSRGNMKERTGFGGPLQLDYEQVLTQHTAKVIKDISHREFMLTANKLLMDPQIRQTLRDTLGEGNEAQMMPWLRTIINDRNGSAVQGLGDLSNLMNKARTNVVKAALGFKFSTVLLQLTHASSILLHTSPGSYAQAMIDFLAHPNEMSDQIRGLSPNEMSARGENIDRDMRKVLQGGIEKKSIGDLWANLGMKPVQLMDHVLSFPLWLSVYRDALAENTHLGESEAKYQAMHKADGAVRMGLGSNAPKDLAPIMRKNDLTKLLTTMGGFHNLKWNQMSDVASQFGRDRNVGNLTYGMLMAAVIPSIMGPLITSHGPKDDENKGVWAAKRALLFPAETMAVVNIAVEAMENGGDVRFSPIVSTMERAAKAGVHATADKEDKDWTGIGMDALQSAMDFYGVSGTDQGFKTLRYGRKAQQGKIDNPNVFDAVAGSPRK